MPVQTVTVRGKREHGGLPLLPLTKLVVFEVRGSALNSWISLGNNRLYWKVRLKQIIWQTGVIVVCQEQRNWSSEGAWHCSTWRRHFEFIQITLFFHAFFDEAEKKNSNGSTSKFILYVIKRLHAKIGACIRPPVTINTLCDLTKCLSQYIQFRVVDMDICKLLGYVQFTITNTITIYLTSSMKKGNKSLLGKQTNKYLQPSQYVRSSFLYYFIHFRYSPNNCSLYTKLWHRTYPIVLWRFTLEIGAGHRFAPLQKSRQNHRSWMWTEASGKVFVPAQKLSGIVWA